MRRVRALRNLSVQDILNHFGNHDIYKYLPPGTEQNEIPAEREYILNVANTIDRDHLTKLISDANKIAADRRKKKDSVNVRADFLEGFSNPQRPSSKSAQA